MNTINSSNIDNTINKDIISNDQNVKLTAKQKLFCKYYLSKDKKTRLNAKQSYLKAYNCNQITAGSEGFKTLKNPKIQKYLADLIYSEGLNPALLDHELLSLITQNKDLKTKRQSIKDANELLNRIKSNNTAQNSNNLLVIINKSQNNKDQLIVNDHEIVDI